MLKKLITTVTVTLGIAILTACSGGEPASETGIKSDEPRREAAVAAPTSTTAPEPTRPQRLDGLLTPTVTPEAATVEPGTKTAQRERKNGAEPGAMPTPTSIPGLPIMKGPAIKDLVPEDPKTNDQVLLQDIYEQIDLEQFALDPNEPVPKNTSPWTVSPVNYPETSEHPYLHLFNKAIDPPPLGSRDERWEQFRDQPTLKAYLIHFIHHPWFEPMYPNYKRLQDINPEWQNEVTPYWFGNNSTRGILVETVAALLEEAQLPTAEPYPRGWWLSNQAITNDAPRLKNREWTIGEFIRTTVSTEDPIETRQGSLGPCARIFNEQNERHDDTKFTCPAITDSIKRHTTPQVEWEIIHPQLPILRITAHASQTLPLQILPIRPQAKDGSETGWNYTQRVNAETEYSVSFVISLQNRWTSFDEPNRWVTRFREDLTLPNVTERNRGNVFFAIDERVPHPNQWDDTDYMQHRIIGPVVLTVHKSPVLQPGTYSRIPRITHWEAPGHILTDKQIKTYKRGRQVDRRTKDPETGRSMVLREGTPAVRLDPIRYYSTTTTRIPNAGFPLPGHVMTTSTSGPGTMFWKHYEMEQWDEYDKSLSEP